MEEKYEVSLDLLQDLLNYLSNRPYKEVYKLADRMRNLKLVESAPAAIPQPPVVPENSSSGNA